jgi:hypothetical protein
MKKVFIVYKKKTPKKLVKFFMLGELGNLSGYYLLVHLTLLHLHSNF